MARNEKVSECFRLRAAGCSPAGLEECGASQGWRAALHYGRWTPLVLPGAKEV